MSNHLFSCYIYVTFYFRILEIGLEHVQTFGLGYKIVRSH